MHLVNAEVHNSIHGTAVIEDAWQAILSRDLGVFAHISFTLITVNGPLMAENYLFSDTSWHS